MDALQETLGFIAALLDDLLLGGNTWHLGAPGFKVVVMPTLGTLTCLRLGGLSAIVLLVF